MRISAKKTFIPAGNKTIWINWFIIELIHWYHMNETTVIFLNQISNKPSTQISKMVITGLTVLP